MGLGFRGLGFGVPIKAIVQCGVGRCACCLCSVLLMMIMTMARNMSIICNMIVAMCLCSWKMINIATMMLTMMMSRSRESYDEEQ